MKKITFLFLSILLMLSLTSCGQSSQNSCDYLNEKMPKLLYEFGVSNDNPSISYSSFLKKENEDGSYYYFNSDVQTYTFTDYSKDKTDERVMTKYFTNSNKMSLLGKFKVGEATKDQIIAWMKTNDFKVNKNDKSGLKDTYSNKPITWYTYHLDSIEVNFAVFDESTILLEYEIEIV